MEPNLKARYSAIDGLRALVFDGSEGLSHVPKALAEVINSGAWREFVVRGTGEVVRYERFIDFVTTKPLEGLGTDRATLERLCSGDTDVLLLLRKEWTAPVGRPAKASARENNDNIIIKPQQGTSKAYTLTRLESEAPELYARVVAKEISASQAAREAGFRRPVVTVRTDDPASAARTLASAYGERLGELVAALDEHRRPR